MADQEPRQSSQEGYIWSAEMPLLTSRFFLYDMAKLLAWTGLICGILFSGIALYAGGPEAVPKMLAIFALILGGFGFLFALIALIFFGNGYPAGFYVGPNGIGWESASKRGAAASRAATVVGALAGSPGAAGAGLLAQAQESGLLAWNEISRVKAYPAFRVLTVMNSWRVVVRLYCTPENYQYVFALVRHYAPQAVMTVQPAPQGTGRAPVGILELLRRAGLAGGIAASLWFAFDAPPLLIHLRRADFAAEYQRKYGESKGPVFGAMGMAREFLREHANPGSIEAFIAQKTEHRIVNAKGPEWSRLHAGLGPAGRWYRPDDEPVARLMPEIRKVYSRATWLVMYLPVENGYVEIEYVNRPKESKAPAALIYPNREMWWVWALAGIAIYCLLPWPSSSPRVLLHDGAVSLGLDLIGTMVSAFFLALPAYVAHSTEEALGEELGITLFLWAMGAIGLAILLWSAARASFHVSLEPHQLRVGRLAGGTMIPGGEVSSVEYTWRGEAPTGIVVSSRGGARQRIGWQDLPHFEGLLELLRGWGHAPRPGAA